MVIVYGSEKEIIDNSLYELTKNNSFVQDIQRYSCLEDVESRLRQPHPDIGLLIFFVKDAIEISKMTHMRSILLDLDIVIALPYHNNDMVSWAHMLGPRYISYGADDQKNLTCVLKKLLDSSPMYYG